MNDIWVWLKMGYIPKLWLLTSGWNGVQSPILYFMAKNDRMHVQQHLFTHDIYIYIYIPGTPYDHFFAVIWPNTAEFGEMTIFLGHMPIFGCIWRQVACLKNIDKYWKHIENLLKSCKIGQYWKNIEKYWEHIGNILEKYSCHDYPRMRAT